MPEGHGHRARRPLRHAQGRWPTTWIAGWPTSRSWRGANRLRAGPGDGRGGIVLR